MSPADLHWDESAKKWREEQEGRVPKSRGLNKPPWVKKKEAEEREKDKKKK